MFGAIDAPLQHRERTQLGGNAADWTALERIERILPKIGYDHLHINWHANAALRSGRRLAGTEHPPGEPTLDRWTVDPGTGTPPSDQSPMGEDTGPADPFSSMQNTSFSRSIGSAAGGASCRGDARIQTCIADGLDSMKPASIRPDTSTSTAYTAEPPPSATPADETAEWSAPHPDCRGLPRPRPRKRVADTAGDSDDEPASSSARPSGSDAFAIPDGFTREQIQPFHDLERQYATLFQTPHIRAVRSARDIQAGRTMDVDMDECAVINLAQDGFDSIGTHGLSSCVCICAKGTNPRDHDILGLLHYSGIQDAQDAQDALSEIRDDMREEGVQNPERFLVGGMISNQDELGSFEIERDLLALQRPFNIVGAKLHPSMSDRNGEENAINLVMTANGIYYYKSW
ncbi:XopAK family type III secretion system effector [Xanthomonas axonopodis]|nr:XopAK family type III secretion system effector [Xanthomonas axonopodis]